MSPTVARAFRPVGGQEPQTGDLSWGVSRLTQNFEVSGGDYLLAKILVLRTPTLKGQSQSKTQRPNFPTAMYGPGVIAQTIL
jgi:hypothetical protein